MSGLQLTEIFKDSGRNRIAGLELPEELRDKYIHVISPMNGGSAGTRGYGFQGFVVSVCDHANQHPDAGKKFFFGVRPVVKADDMGIAKVELELATNELEITPEGVKRKDLGQAE